MAEDIFDTDEDLPIGSSEGKTEEFDIEEPDRFEYTEEKVRENPHLSLVKYNMTAGSPITQFFSDFDENAVDPFTAASKFSSTFYNKMKVETAETDQLRQVRAQLFIQQQADRLKSSLNSYETEMQRATTYTMYNSSPVSTTTKDLYSSPTGFVPRPTHYDMYSLLASQENKSMSLRSSMYEIHSNYYVAALNQRSGPTELITQTYTDNGKLPTLGNEGSMRILLGNDVAAKVLREKEGTTIKTVSNLSNETQFSFHAKVGYFSQTPGGPAEKAFISTQNPTHTLARAHTTEEMLVLTRKSDLVDEGRIKIRNQLIQDIQNVTDSIYSAFDSLKSHSPGTVSVEAMRNHLSLADPKQLVQKVTEIYKGKSESRQPGINQSVFVGKQIQQEIANRLTAESNNKNSKVVLSIQYLETLLIQENSSKNIASKMAVDGGDDYNTSIRKPILEAIKKLAQSGRVTIGLAGDSYGSQGLFNLLDKYYDADVKDNIGKDTVKALIENNAFSVLPTRFAHSKSFAVYEENKLTTFGIGSSNISLNAYENNLEVSMILGKEELKGLTDKEQEDILSYYRYGVGNFESKNISSPTERKGNKEQTQKLIELLKSMGGKQTRSMSEEQTPFTFSIRYGRHNYEPVGLDIRINSINKDLPGYSFSVTVGEEQGLRGAEPIVYLSKTNRVINGMTYVNNSSKVLELYNGQQIQPRSAIDMNALDVVAGLITTMRHMLTFEATRGSLNKALNTMSFDNRKSSIDKILGVMLHQELRLNNIHSTYDSKQTFTQIIKSLTNNLDIESSQKISILQNMVQRFISVQEETRFAGMRDEDLILRKQQIETIFSTENINKIFNDQVESTTGSKRLIRELTMLMDNMRSNPETGTIYADILRLMLKSDKRAEDFYISNMAKVKTAMFNQITSPFMQPHELRYSMGQALLKKPVYGINDELYKLAALQGVINNNQGVILSPHDLHHGEILETVNGTFIRGKSDHRRITQNLYEQQGGIYNVDEGAVSIRHTKDMMQVMRGLSLIKKEEYEQQIRESLKDSGLTDPEKENIVDKLSQELFSLNRLTNTNNKGELLYFPYRVPEQVVERLRNLQSTRPVESASRSFATYVDTMGAVGLTNRETDDVLNYENIITGDFLTTVAPHQFQILRQRIKSSNPSTVLTEIRKDEYGNSQTLLRGFLGGQAPKRVLQSVGVSSMSDFSYVNEGFRYDSNDITTKPEYVQFHTTSISLDQSRLLTSTSFKENVTKNLKRGTTFIHKDQEITNSQLKTALTNRAKTLALSLLSEDALTVFNDELSGRPLSQTLINELEEYKQYKKLQQETINQKFTTLHDSEGFTLDDKLTNKLLKKLISLKYESVEFDIDTNKFYFKGGVYSPASSETNAILDRLQSVKKIGSVNTTGGYFTLDAFKQYDNVGFENRRTSYIPFKITATAAREYRGISVLVEDPFIDQSGPSSLQLHLQTATRRDMVSNLRPGSDTSKGPSVMVKQGLFDQLRAEQEERGLHTLLSKRIQKQDIYAILSPSQIKGFNFEQGLMLIEDRSSDFIENVTSKDSKFKTALAEGLALLMLSEKPDSTKILQLLGESFKGVDDKSQAYQALNILSRQNNFAKKAKLPKRDVNSSSIGEQIGPTYTLFGELVSLALPEFLKSEDDPSQALIKTVAAALDTKHAKHFEALEQIRSGASNLFKTARNDLNAIKVGDRFVFNDATTRTASLLAIATKFSQDIFTNINSQKRLNSNAISELNPGYLIDKLDAYTNPTQDFERALVKSVQVAGSLLNIHLPSPEDIQKAKEEGKETEKLEELRLGLYQLNTTLRFNRFLEFGMEQMPSRVAVAMGMQNMTKMEGQYMYELTKNQMGLFTDIYKENSEVTTIQRAVLLLGSIVEGQLLDPVKAKSKYGLQVNNLAFRGTTNFQEDSMQLLFGERYTELMRLYGELDKVQAKRKELIAIKRKNKKRLLLIQSQLSDDIFKRLEISPGGTPLKRLTQKEQEELDKQIALRAELKSIFEAEETANLERAEDSGTVEIIQNLKLKAKLTKSSLDTVKQNELFSILKIDASVSREDIDDRVTVNKGVAYNPSIGVNQNEYLILKEIERIDVANESGYTYLKASNINKILNNYNNSPILFTSKYLTNYSPYADQDLPLIVGDKGKNNLSLSRDAITKYIEGNYIEAQRNLEIMGQNKKLFLGIVESSPDSIKNNLETRLALMEEFMLEKLLSDDTKLTQLRLEVNKILGGREDQNIIERVKSLFEEGKGTKDKPSSLITPDGYYVKLLSNIANRLSSEGIGAINNEELKSVLTKDLLEESGVYKHYREHLENRVRSSIELSYGAEYVNYGLQSLKNVSELALRALKSDTASIDQKKRAQGLYDQVTKTRIVSLPALSIKEISEGEYKAFYSPDTVSTSSYGIVLGLDLLQKLSLVFQTQTHEALSTQIQLINAISESEDLINKLTYNLMTNNNPNDMLTNLSHYEIQQYMNLQQLLLKSQTSTFSLLANQETIRQAAAERMKLIGVSSIAMSSLLLNSDEIVAGDKFIDVAQSFDFNRELKAKVSDPTHKLITHIKTAVDSSKLIIREGPFDLSDAKEFINTDSNLAQFKSPEDAIDSFFRIKVLEDRKRKTSNGSTESTPQAGTVFILERVDIFQDETRLTTPIFDYLQKFTPPYPPIADPWESEPSLTAKPTYQGVDPQRPPHRNRAQRPFTSSEDYYLSSSMWQKNIILNSRDLTSDLILPDNIRNNQEIVNRLQVVVFKDRDYYTEKTKSQLTSEINNASANIDTYIQQLNTFKDDLTAIDSNIETTNQNIKNLDLSITDRRKIILQEEKQRRERIIEESTNRIRELTRQQQEVRNLAFAVSDDKKEYNQRLNEINNEERELTRGRISLSQEELTNLVENEVRLLAQESNQSDGFILNHVLQQRQQSESDNPRYVGDNVDNTSRTQRSFNRVLYKRELARYKSRRDRFTRLNDSYTRRISSIEAQITQAEQISSNLREEQDRYINELSRYEQEREVYIEESNNLLAINNRIDQINNEMNSPFTRVSYKRELARYKSQRDRSIRLNNSYINRLAETENRIDETRIRINEINASLVNNRHNVIGPLREERRSLLQSKEALEQSRLESESPFNSFESQIRTTARQRVSQREQESRNARLEQLQQEKHSLIQEYSSKYGIEISDDSNNSSRLLSRQLDELMHNHILQDLQYNEAIAQQENRIAEARNQTVETKHHALNQDEELRRLRIEKQERKDELQNFTEQKTQKQTEIKAKEAEKKNEEDRKQTLELHRKNTPQVAYAFDPQTKIVYPQPHDSYFSTRVNRFKDDDNVDDLALYDNSTFNNDINYKQKIIEGSTQLIRNTILINYLNSLTKASLSKDELRSLSESKDLYSILDNNSYQAFINNLTTEEDSKLRSILPEDYSSFDKLRKTTEFILKTRYLQEGYVETKQELETFNNKLLKGGVSLLNAFIESTGYFTADQVNYLKTHNIEDINLLSTPGLIDDINLLSTPGLLSRFQLNSTIGVSSYKKAVNQQYKVEINQPNYWNYTDFTQEEAIEAFERLRGSFNREEIEQAYKNNPNFSRMSLDATPLITAAQNLILDKFRLLEVPVEFTNNKFVRREAYENYLRLSVEEIQSRIDDINLLSTPGLLSRFQLNSNYSVSSYERAVNQRYKVEINQPNYWNYLFTQQEAIEAFERLRGSFNREEIEQAYRNNSNFSRMSLDATPLITAAQSLMGQTLELINQRSFFDKFRLLKAHFNFIDSDPVKQEVYNTYSALSVEEIQTRIDDIERLSAPGLLSRFQLSSDIYVSIYKRALNEDSNDQHYKVELKNPSNWDYTFSQQEAIDSFERLRGSFNREEIEQAYKNNPNFSRMSTDATPLINQTETLISQKSWLEDLLLLKSSVEFINKDSIREAELSVGIRERGRRYKAKTEEEVRSDLSLSSPITLGTAQISKRYTSKRKTIKNFREYNTLKDEVESLTKQLGQSNLEEEVRESLLSQKEVAEQRLKELVSEDKTLTISGKVDSKIKELKQTQLQIAQKQKLLEAAPEDTKGTILAEIDELTIQATSLRNEAQALHSSETRLTQKLRDKKARAAESIYKQKLETDKLNEIALEYTEIKRQYFREAKGEEFHPDLNITGKHLENVYDFEDGRLKYQSRASIDEYILDLILAKNQEDIEKAQSAFDVRKKEYNKVNTEEERKLLDIQTRGRIDERLAAHDTKQQLRATMTRSGGPAGTSILSETGTELKKVITVNEYQKNAESSGTLVVPGDSGTSTLMLMSALGNHYTQLGDNDGDSFQSAVTQMAVLTKRIREEQKALAELVDLKKQYESEPDKNLSKKLRNQELIDKENQLKQIKKNYFEMLNQYNLLIKQAHTKAEKGVRMYAEVYSALPEELLNNDTIKDIHLKSFVKQFRETLGGLSDNTGSVNRSTDNILTPSVLNSIRLESPASTLEEALSAKLTINNDADWLKNYDPSEQNRLKQQAISAFEQYRSLIKEDEESRQSIDTKLTERPESDIFTLLKEQVIEGISHTTNIDAAVNTTTGKPLKSAFGSILNDDILQELQSIIGTSTGGLLGTTYNTVVPLISFQLANIGALKALKSTEDKAYRLALAASLMAKKDSKPHETSEFLEGKLTEMLTGNLTTKTIIANIKAENSIKTALRFIITTQQFIRDAGLKPKEPKGTSVKSVSLLESFAKFEMRGEDRGKYNLSSSEYDDNLKGLHNIFKAIEAANTPEDSTVLREQFLQHYLSTEVGDKLNVNQGEKYDERLSQLRTFGALQLLTDYLSGKYSSATDLINNSALSNALTSARGTEQYSTSVGDDDFVQQYITDLFLNFQEIYTSGQTSIDIENRAEQVSSIDRILESYGLDNKGNKLSSYNNKIQEMVDTHLLQHGLSGDASADDDLNKYSSDYRQTLESRADAISKAIRELSPSDLSNQEKVYEATMKAITSHKILTTRDEFISGLRQLKDLHSAMSKMRTNSIPGGDKLEAELSLYTQLFANRIASGHTDLNLWSGFFGSMMSSIANIDSGSDDEINSLKMSMLGLTGSLFDSPNTEASDSFRNSFLEASMHTPSYQEKYELAKQYTKLQYASSDVDALALPDFSSDSEEEQKTTFEAAINDLKNLVTSPDDESERAKYINFLDTIDQIKNLDPSKSAIDYASETNSFTYALKQLNVEYSYITDKLKTNSDLSEDEKQGLESRAKDIENMISSPEENKQKLLEEFSRLEYSEEDANNFIKQLDEQMNAILKDQIEESNKVTRTKIAKNAGRLNSFSEGISILAIPALFALMDSPEDSLGQVVSGLSEAYQSLVSSPVAMGYSPKLVQTEVQQSQNERYAQTISRSMQISRIRSQIRYNDSVTAGLFAGLAFESIYKASSILTQKAANLISEVDPNFNNSVKGRFATELLGGMIGITAANLITNSQMGLPQEDLTELNNALLIIDQIRQSTQAAFHNFTEAIISSISEPVDAADSESGYYTGTASYNQEVALTSQERMEVTGGIAIFFEDEA